MPRYVIIEARIPPSLAIDRVRIHHRLRIGEKSPLEKDRPRDQALRVEESARENRVNQSGALALNTEHVRGPP